MPGRHRCAARPAVFNLADYRFQMEFDLAGLDLVRVEQIVDQRPTCSTRCSIAPSIVLPDAALAIDRLGGLPGILQAADTPDRRAILQSLFTSVTLEPHVARKAKARDEYRELLLKIDQKVESTDWWAGWAPVCIPPHWYIYPEHSARGLGATA